MSRAKKGQWVQKNYGVELLFSRLQKLIIKNTIDIAFGLKANILTILTMWGTTDTPKAIPTELPITGETKYIKIGKTLP